jgi:Ser/Thr protein kinase RdoA (MazF antagonist)
MTRSTEPNILAAHFGLPDAQVVHIHIGYRGTHTTRLEQDGRILFLRQYPEFWRGRADAVVFELGWLEALLDRGLSVVRPVPTLDGKPFCFDNELPVAAFEFVPGEPRYPLSAEESSTLGQLLAEIHLTPTPPASSKVFRYDAITLLEEPLAFGLRFLSGNDAEEWTSLGNALRAALVKIPVQTPAFGAVHADTHQWNVHWVENRSTFLDFALCGVGFRLFDLASFLWPRRDATFDEPGIREMCDAFLQGYEHVRPLLATERAALEAFVKLRDLWEMNDFAGWDSKFNATQDVPGLLTRFRTFPLGSRPLV